MKTPKKFNPIYMLGATLLILSNCICYVSSWVLFHEVEPPKSFLE